MLLCKSIFPVLKRSFPIIQVDIELPILYVCCTLEEYEMVYISEGRGNRGKMNGMTVSVSRG